MIWMSWRQFRAQALVGAVALIVLAAYLVFLGLRIRSGYTDTTSGCGQQAGSCAQALLEFKNQFKGRIYSLDAVIVFMPALIGLFWGAPLIARELESGTHRLVWNQSITRRRWLAVKLLFVGLAAMLLAGLASVLLTWAASPFDQVSADRFSTLFFGTRNIVPIAYAGFAFVLGAVLGIFIRRTVPAMALTFLIFIVIQVFVPNAVRPHLMTPISSTQQLTPAAIKNVGMLGRHPTVSGLKIPGAWVTYSSELLTPDEKPLDDTTYNNCTRGSFDAAADCLGQLNLHVEVKYQPLNRYWTFQWLESAIFVGLALLLGALGSWRIRGRLS